MKVKTKLTVGTFPENSEPPATEPLMTNTGKEEDPASAGLEENNVYQELKSVGEDKMEEVMVHQSIACKNADQVISVEKKAPPRLAGSSKYEGKGENAEEVTNGRDVESDMGIKANNDWEEENLYCGLGDLDTAKEVNTGEGSGCAKQAPSECESEKGCLSGDVLGKGTSEMSAGAQVGAFSGSTNDAEKDGKVVDNLGVTSSKAVKKTKKIIRRRKLVKKGNQALQTEVELLPLDDIEEFEVNPENEVDAADGNVKQDEPDMAEEMDITAERSGSVILDDMEGHTNDGDGKTSEHVGAIPVQAKKMKKVIKKKKVVKGSKVTGHIAEENVQPSDGHDVEIREKLTYEMNVPAALPGDMMEDSKTAAGGSSQRVGKIPAKVRKLMVRKKKAVNGAQDDVKFQSDGKNEEKVEAKSEKITNNRNGASKKKKVVQQITGAIPVKLNEPKSLEAVEPQGRRMGKMEKQSVKTGKEEKRSEEKINSSRKRSRKGKTKQDMKKGAFEAKVKADSSGKKSSKKAETMGMIFMCSSKTKKDCHRYKVLGLPARKKDLVAKIYKGMRLFLFDFESRLMYGIYKAADRGGYNIEPKAFNSEFPSQVRFTILEDCKPLSEQQFKNAIKDNYYTSTKFNFQLNSDQVKKLCKLFIATSRDAKSKRVNGPTKRGRSPVEPERGRRKRGRSPAVVGRDRRLALDDRTYHRHVPLAADEGYDRRPVVYEREAYVAPAVLPHARLPSPLPQHDIPARASYAYGRTSDLYQWDRAIERERAYQERRHRDELQHYDLGLTVAERRQRDPYLSYREPLEYHSGVYTTGLRPEYYPAGHSDGYHASLARSADEYRAPLGPTTEEYRTPVRLASDYPGVRLSYRRY